MIKTIYFLKSGPNNGLSKENFENLEIIIENSGKVKGYSFNDANELCQFNYLNNEQEKIGFHIVLMESNEQLGEMIIRIIRTAHQKVPEIKTSNICELQTYEIKEEGQIEKVVFSLLNRISNDENMDTFDFISHLLFRLTNCHAYYNGNKRTALLSVFMILEYFGYYLCWGSDKSRYISFWESFMLEIASFKNEQPENEFISNIKTRLLELTWLNFKNRK